jgi:UDP-N-acetylglucosamine 4,6-dehydratase/5-epimerase
MEDDILKNSAKDMLLGKTLLVTGGTGSFGKAFIKYVLKNYSPKKIIVYSRDEMKQYLMAQDYRNNRTLQFIIGDIRDKEKLERMCRGVDYIIHTAAIKIVPTAEENPSEAVKTNVIGAMNIIDAAIKNNVKRVIAFSTDKACNPVNLYGATKLCSDKLFIAANSYSETLFSIVRYGNVIGSRGSIIPIFLEKKKEGVIPVTDERMTRFWITLEQGVEFVIKNLNRMRGGEIFVPKIPSMKIIDLVKAIAPECRIEYIGIKSGEKLHEAMIAPDDARNTTEFIDYYIIRPQCSWWVCEDYPDGKSVPEGFSYMSNTNPHFLTIDQMRELIKDFQ